MAYQLRFPRGLQAQSVTAFVTGLSGLVAPWYAQPFVARAVVFEVSASASGIEHYILMPRSLAPLVLASLRAALPSVGVRPDHSYQPMVAAVAAELGLSDHGRTLAVDQAAAIGAAILASLQPLEPGERLVVQWSASPLGPVAATPSPARSESWSAARQLLAGGSGEQPDAEAVQAARLKQRTPLFLACGRVGVTATNAGRARSLLARVLAAFHVANAPGVRLYRRNVPSGTASRRLVERRLPLLAIPCTLNAVELGALTAFPLDDLSLPGLQLGGSRQLAPASDIPSAGRVLMRATFPGSERLLALSEADSLRHLHALGPTGVGKSNLLLGLIEQDMHADRGVVVIEPSGDLVSDVLDRVPPHRFDDVIVLDPTDETRPVGLNILAGAGAAPELVVEQVVAIFHQLYKAFWGPRTDDILRAALATLVDEPGATLVEVPLLLTDAAYRRRLVGRVDDLILQQFWGAFEGWSDGERAQAISPILNKMRAFLMRRRLRNVLGQAQPAFDLDRALAERKIVLVPLVKGLLGEEAAELIGSLFVSRLWQAVQRRSALAPIDRPLTFAYIDEFQNYVRLPLSMADTLAEARKLRLGMTLAHQNLSQLPQAMREAVLANARSRVTFQLAAADAKVIERELAPYLTAADLQGLGTYEVVASLSAGTRVAPPVTGQTLPPSAPTGLGAAARQRSRQRYGVDRAEVEAAIERRHLGQPGAGPVGRREARA